ncbi:hypothetical protein VKT23_015340 [Stygiomarasmius scandens]|uniref:Uncharacterized protein n=1 Tax=Marasmiellus scandens TaxID=2682957 RepID=A0ABR1IY41_9AGAR
MLYTASQLHYIVEGGDSPLTPSTDSANSTLNSVSNSVESLQPPSAPSMPPSTSQTQNISNLSTLYDEWKKELVSKLKEGALVHRHPGATVLTSYLYPALKSSNGHIPVPIQDYLNFCQQNPFVPVINCFCALPARCFEIKNSRNTSLNGKWAFACAKSPSNVFNIQCKFFVIDPFCLRKLQYLGLYSEKGPMKSVLSSIYKLFTSPSKKLGTGSSMVTNNVSTFEKAKPEPFPMSPPPATVTQHSYTLNNTLGQNKTAGSSNGILGDNAGDILPVDTEKKSAAEVIADAYNEIARAAEDEGLLSPIVKGKGKGKARAMNEDFDNSPAMVISDFGTPDKFDDMNSLGPPSSQPRIYLADLAPKAEEPIELTNSEPVPKVIDSEPIEITDSSDPEYVKPPTRLLLKRSQLKRTRKIEDDYDSDDDEIEFIGIKKGPIAGSSKKQKTSDHTIPGTSKLKGSTTHRRPEPGAPLKPGLAREVQKSLQSEFNDHKDVLDRAIKNGMTAGLWKTWKDQFYQCSLLDILDSLLYAIA